MATSQSHLKPDLTVDVAVVGAGVSGAYTAYRLQEHFSSRGTPHTIALFEYTDRVGGRLLSRTLPGMPHVWAELGGMRYLPAFHILVTSLIDHLKMPHRKFPMGNPDPAIGGNANYVYLRRRRLLAGELNQPDKVPYNVLPSERGKSPGDLAKWVIDRLVPNAAKLSEAEWFEVKALGKELYRWGYWNLLDRVLSNEAVDFSRDAGGYDDGLTNGNSVRFLHNVLQPESDFQTLRDGFDKLPIQLVDQFRRGRGQLHSQLRLASIHRAPSVESVTPAAPAYVMKFVKTFVDERGSWRDHPDSGLLVHARRIVLAMPRRPLQKIDWEGLRRAPLRQAVESVIRAPAFKLHLGYEYPWWRSLGLYAGPSVTDLPLRKCYYFGTEGEQEGADSSNHNSLLMATYNDDVSLGFWKGFEKDREGHPSADMVETASRQLRELHGLDDIPRPYAAIFHDWGQDPFDGGWHVWKAGVRYDQTMKFIRKPLHDEGVHICGEAYSNNQGWVEGALQTAERMLEEHFGLPRPSWLPADYDLGP